jgi:hypothetical protein
MGLCVSPVSGRCFSISVSRCPRPVRKALRPGRGAGHQVSRANIVPKLLRLSLAKEQLLQTDAVVLLSPGVRQSPGKTSDGNTCRGSTFNERRDDPGRYEGEGSQQAYMPFTLAFLLCDVFERCNSALPKVVNPSPGFDDGAEQGIPALGPQCGPCCRGRMKDSLDGSKPRGRPGQRDGGRWQAVGLRIVRRSVVRWPPPCW